MDLNARVDVNCRRKDGRTENRMLISHLAEAGATNIYHYNALMHVFCETGFSNAREFVF